MPRQSTSTIIMVQPDHFGFNPQTAITNPFQHTPKTLHKSSKEIRADALSEFAAMAKKLKENGVEVLIMPNNSDSITPDAVFPNNWFSTHQEGKLVLYPLLTPNRRLERQKEKLLVLLKKVGIANPEIVDLTKDEEKGLILESTGSFVLDRVHKVAFAFASPRTMREEFEKWCQLMDYEGVFLLMTKKYTKEVYHTNIAMCVGSEFVIVCLEILENKAEQKKLQHKLTDLGKEVIVISAKQMYAFCGNILELQTRDGKKIIVMSETAKNAFTREQLSRLDHYGSIISPAISTIEQVGGGGVRCMIAEVFPPEYE